MFLTDDEIRELTRRVHHNVQSNTLSKMGIEHRLRPDGSIAVLRSHVESILSGKPDKKTKIITEPNWGALNAAST
ncbi:MAG: DUF4224 domain-containing protein [Burkholderiales bacterium]|nr:DUF4224 domain-containing protein [Burkholderiales bacterium]